MDDVVVAAHDIREAIEKPSHVQDRALLMAMGLNNLHASRHLSGAMKAVAVIPNKLSFRLTTQQTLYW